MNKAVIFWSIFITFMSANPVNAQIAPPGLNNTNVAAWFAVGLKQKLDSAGKIQSMAFVGWERIGNPTYNNPFQKTGIFMISEEVSYRFLKNWQSALGVLYMRQNFYKTSPPFDNLDPYVRQEFRVYGKFTHVYSTNKLNFTTQITPEYRKFYGPNFNHWRESVQLRTRLKFQLQVNLTKTKQHRLTLSTELFFSASKLISPVKKWKSMDYKETYFYLAYTFAPKKTPFLFSLGYMNDLIGKQKAYSIHYIGLDVIWMNPFHKKVKKALH
jgi:hypothetical protein